MLKIEIRRWDNQEVIHSGYFNSIKECLRGLLNMKEYVEIKRLDNQEVIHSGYFNSIKECLEDGVKKGISFYRADLRKANLRDANLENAILRCANLENAFLRCANLENAFLYNSRLAKANLENANLTGANLTGANLRKVYLWYCKGNNKEIKNISIFDEYEVVYTKDILQIGCEGHLIEDWKGFSDEVIFKMDGQRGLDFWHKNKEFIFNKIKEDPVL